MGDGDGDGKADGRLDGLGLGEGVGLGDGLELADALGEAEGVGEAVQAPGRNGLPESLPQPILTPEGGWYQSRMLLGRALMKRRMIVRPTFSP